MASENEEAFLSLGLAVNIVTEKKLKRKRMEALAFWDLNESCEGKIFSLLEMREEMTKMDQKRETSSEDGKGLHLIHSLLISATSVDENDISSAVDNLRHLYQNISLFGDSLQRVAAYFADGLLARLLTRKSPFYDMIMKTPTREQEFTAFTQFYKVSPFFQFAHFTANQTIIEKFEEEEPGNNRSIHIIDHDICYGFQWPSLIQSLSEMATSSNRISLKITGFGRSLDELQETETRLVSFSKAFRSLVFEFQGVLTGSSSTSTVFENLIKRRKNETVVVNLVFHLNTVANISETLKSVTMINPSVVIMVEQEGSKSPQNFLSRFMESLHYYAAMFDSLDDCLHVESSERLSIEKNHLGKEIKRLMNYEMGILNSPRFERMETWKGKMESHDFEAAKLSSKSLIQANLLLKIRAHCSPVQFDGGNGGFRIFENNDGKAISLGWQDRCLITASAWRCVQ